MSVSDDKFSPEEQRRRFNALLKAAINTPKPTRKLTKAELKALPEIHKMSTEEMEKIADAKATTRAETVELTRLSQADAEERELARLRARRTQLLLKYGGSHKNLTQAEREALDKFQGPVKVARASLKVRGDPVHREQKLRERTEKNRILAQRAESRAARKSKLNDAVEYVTQVGFTVEEAAHQTGCSISSLRTRLDVMNRDGADMGLYQETVVRARQNGQLRSYRNNPDRPRGNKPKPKPGE